MLDEFVIEAQVAELIVKGDTLEYNPAAFKMQEGSVVEDLLKRLPGIEVETDGKITTTAGKQVRRVFVDGKEFFGTDPTMATQNLTIDIIDKVQVVEKKTDEAILTGVDDGETETIINLITKKNMSQGWFGNVSAGAGALVDNKTGEAPRYNTRNMLNRFTENSQSSFIVNANNINSRDGSGGGNMGGGSSSGGRGDSGGGNSGGGGSRGITNSNTAGFNTSSIINEKLKVGGNVRYTYTDAFTKQNSFRTNLLIDSVSYRNSASQSNRYAHALNFDAKMEYKPDSFYTIVFAPQLSFSSSESYGKSSQETLAGDIDSTLVNRSNTRTSALSNGLVLSGELTITRRFERKGRQLSFRVNGNMNHNLNNGTNLSDNEFFLQPGRNKKLDQESETSSNTGTFGFRASYVEPLRQNMTLQTYYDFRQNKTRNIRETLDYNPDDGMYSLLNRDYSQSMDNNFITQIIGISLNGSSTKYYYNFGMNVSPSYTQSTKFIKNGATNGSDSILNTIAGRRVVNLSPQINYTHRFSRQTDLRFTYRGNTRQPSVTQLDPTPDNTNPLNIRSGNPDLLPSYINTASLRFNTNQREKQRSLTANLDYSFTRNEIINYTEYEEGTGIQYTAPRNENGSWSSSGSILFSSPLTSNRRLRFSLNAQVNYNNAIGYTIVQKQSQRNVSNTFTPSGNISLSYTKDWFYGRLRANARYQNTTFSLEGKEKQVNANFGGTYETQWTLPWNMTFDSDINYRATRGLSAGYNKNELLWNAGLNKRFLKGNNGSLRIQWTDILQQRLSISRSISANYIEDSESNILTSYVLVTFAYRFNNLSGGNNRNRSREEFQERPQRDGQDRPGGGSRDSGGQRGGPGDYRQGGGGGRF